MVNPERTVLRENVKDHAVDLSDPYGDQVQVARTRHVVTERTNADGTRTLVYRASTMKKGKTRATHGGQEIKTFARWSTDSLASITDRGDGSWLLRSRSMTRVTTRAGRRRKMLGGFTSAIVLAEDLASLDNQLPMLMNEAREHLSHPKKRNDYYPLFDYFVPNYTAANRGAPAFPHETAVGPAPWACAPVRRSFARSEDARGLTVSLFGKSRFRKDLAKAVAMADLSRIELAWQFRGLVPIDWIINYLRRPAIGPGEVSQFSAINVRPYLRRLDQQSLKNLLRDQDPTPRYLIDITRSTLADVGRVKTWEDLHDRLAMRDRLYRHTKGKRLPKLVLTEAQQALIGTTDGGLKVTLARHEDDLWLWGTKMNNCILNYGSQMRGGQTWLGAVKSPEGHLLANFEIQHRASRGETEKTSTMHQLLGKSNTHLDDAVRDDIETYLTAHDVVVPDDYWGARGPRPAQEARAAVHHQAHFQDHLRAARVPVGAVQIAQDEADDDW